MTWALWQRYLHHAVVAAGAAFVTHGIMTAHDANYIKPYVEAFVGSTVSLAAVLWTWWTSRPSQQ